MGTSALPLERPKATRSADFQSAVSQTCSLLGARQFKASGIARWLADWKSAIQQTESLRYIGNAEVRQAGNTGSFN